MRRLMGCHIRKNEVVEVIAGDHKGARGKVLRVDPKRKLVVVEGVNVVFRHVRRSRRNPQGGRLEKEAPIHVSNVLPVDAKMGKGTRVRFEVERDSTGKVAGKKRLGRSGSVLGSVTKSRPGT
jgi:large subunit ribosomal protein L24